MKILISAYACEPGQGSEPGAGWNWVHAASRNHEVWVLTRANNRPAIEAALGDSSSSGPRFVYLDLPRRARFWKRGQRGVRLYYFLWQILAGRVARQLHRQQRFDVVHHLTFGNAWLPALACMTTAPFVLGPLSGGQRVPFSLYTALGIRGTSAELVLLALRGVSRLNPLIRVAWSRADVILINNEDTRRVLPRRYREKCVLRTHTCFEGSAEVASPQDTGLVAMYAGRLHRFKGVSLAIRAIRHLPEWQLTIVGEGPDEARLKRIVRREGLEGRVTFMPPLCQSDLWREMSGCRAFVFPTLKEGGGFVAAEAQALGVPVVAFDMGGPKALARVPGARFELVKPERERASIRGFVQALERLETKRFTEPRADFGLGGVARDIDIVYTSAGCSARC